GDPATERAYRTHWTPPELPEPQRERLTARHSRPPDLVVIQPLAASTCTACSRSDADLLTMDDAAPLCLACADLDHLVFLPARAASAASTGSVRRTAASRNRDNDAVTSAVVASVRPADTRYDALLMSGVPRAEARRQVRADIDDVLDAWRGCGTRPSPR